MSPHLPTVQGAMAAVSRRLKLRRISLPRKDKGVRTTNAAFPFVSPFLKDLYSQMATPTKSCEVDVGCTLRFFLDASPATNSLCPALTPTTKMLVEKKERSIQSSNSGSSGATNSAQQQQIVKDALFEYNPTLNPLIVQKVIQAADIEGTLEQARELLCAVRKGGDFSRLRFELEELYQTSSSVQGMELQVGIASKFRHERRNGRLLRCFRLYTNDLQVTEVLPNGKIVTFTEPTILTATVAGPEGKDQESYLHFVLYKEALSLREAIRLLCEACDGECQEKDFAANIALEESAVTVQVCSLHVRTPVTSSVREYRDAIMRKLVRVNLRPLGLNIQVLCWRVFPCSPSKSNQCRVQYSMLLRGVSGLHSDALERKALMHLAGFPNYFGPRHFGSSLGVRSPFCTYHAAEALERGMPAEALIMTACLSDRAMLGQDGTVWVSELLTLLRSGEDRQTVLRQWYDTHVPWRLRFQIRTSKVALLWNVMASCRIHELKDTALEGVPMPGDFVMQGGLNCMDGGGYFLAKPEFLPECTTFSDEHDIWRKQTQDGAMVVPILTNEDAAPYTIRDIVIPLHEKGGETIRRLANTLGFRSSREKEELPLQWRPLLVTGSGHPRSENPWAKALPEPLGTSVENFGGTYKLLTDMELRQSASYTTASRGQKRGVWPIGKYGHRLAERLPAGLVSLKTSHDGRHIGKALALHLTLPGYAYSMAFLREFIMVENHTTCWTEQKHQPKRQEQKYSSKMDIVTDKNEFAEMSPPYSRFKGVHNSADGNLMVRHP